jgi:hypothetical protein
MCVIIHKPAGIRIPADKIESALDYNSDGFGASFVDRGKFNIRRVLKTNADEVNKFIEEIQDLDAVLHLRYNTKGKTNYDNLHPFTVLNGKKDGENIQFFHNGTISTFGDGDHSDSKHFNHTILRPLFKRMVKAGVNNPIHDPLVESIIEEFRPGGSVFVLYGDNGQVKRFGKGVEIDDWWASNNSYFSPSSWGPNNNNNYSYGSYSNSGGSYVNGVWRPAGSKTTKTNNDDRKDKDIKNTEKENDKKKGGALVPSKEQDIKKLEEEVFSEQAVSRLAEIDDLNELFYYTQGSIEKLVKEHPYEASLIIKDLLQEMYYNA